MKNDVACGKTSTSNYTKVVQGTYRVHGIFRGHKFRSICMKSEINKYQYMWSKAIRKNKRVKIVMESVKFTHENNRVHGISNKQYY